MLPFFVGHSILSRTDKSDQLECLIAVTTTTTKGARRPPRLTWIDSFLWLIRIGAALVVLWGIAGTIAIWRQGGGPTAEAWRDLLVAGIAQGFMYGMIALGYSMVYGVLGFINFAHGEVFMAGGMVGFFAADILFENGMWENNFIFAALIVLAVAVASSTAIAVIVEKVAYRPLRGSPRLIPLITSIGISFFLQYAFAGLFGVGVNNYPQPPEALRGKVDLFGTGFQIEGTKLLVIVVALLSMVVLYFFVERTKTGRAIRAVAEDKEIAALMGINVNRTIVMTFAIGGAMAGVAGFLWAILFRGVSFFTGFLPGIKAFTAAVLGGIGNLVGAMVGGVTLGVFEGVGPQVVLGGLAWELKFIYIELAILAAIAIVLVWSKSDEQKDLSRWALGAVGAITVFTFAVPALRNSGMSLVVPGIAQLKDVVAFSALVLVLVFKPTGLLGERLSAEERA